MTDTVKVVKYGPLLMDTDEIKRFAGMKKDSDAPMLFECLKEIPKNLSAGVCYREYEISRTEEEGQTVLDLGFAQTTSCDLKKNLEGCSRIVLFAATAGMEFDRLIAKYSRLSPAKALWFQAAGATYVEAVCDRFNDEMLAEKGALKPRYSPGYGDLPLALQPAIMSALDCRKYLGITLNESLLMTPSKSVTAIIGILD